jgi:hypothetical protein
MYGVRFPVDIFRRISLRFYLSRSGMADRIINPHPLPIEDIHFLVPPPLEFPHILSEFLASPVEYPQIFIEF